MKKMIASIIALTFIASVVAGQTPRMPEKRSKVGRSAMTFLKIDGSVRSAAMGGALTASVQGADAFFINPSGLAFVENGEAYFNYTDWIAGLNYSDFGIVKNIGNIGSIGIFGIILTTPEIAKTIVALGKSYDTGETYTAQDLAVGVSYAKKVTDFFSWGVNLKFLSETIDDESATSIAVDVGSILELGYRGAKMGACIRNLGSDPKFIDVSSPLPLEFRFGASIDLLSTESHRIILEGGALKVRDYEHIGLLGVEYVYKDFLALRGGHWKINYYPDEEEELSFGLALKFPVSSYKACLEYCLTDMDKLGSRNRFAIRFIF